MERWTIAVVAATCAMVGAVAARQAGGTPQTYKGLELKVTGIQRAPTASLRDCPPGANTVKATAKPGEQFAIVSIAVKVLPGYQPSPLKRPSVTDAAGMTHNTAATFVDVGSVPEFSCAFPFRLPQGTRLKTFQVETASFDVTALDPGKN